MCSLDFFFQPVEEVSWFGDFFNWGNFKGVGCKGSEQQLKETVFILMGFFGICAIIGCVLLGFTNKALKQCRGLALKGDHLERAIVEYDEFCARRGIRGRAETFVSACIEGFFLDVSTTSAWLSVNNLAANIELVDNADYADLLPTGEELVEIEDMRREFNAIVKRLRKTGKLPPDLDFENQMEEGAPEAPPAATPHQLISARMDSTPAPASRQRSADAVNSAAAALIATTPPEAEVPATASTAEAQKPPEAQKLISK